MKRPLLLPSVPLYWLGVQGKNALYNLGWLRVKRLEWPVLSVGSLSVGGAGKTPVVFMLAELLARRGVAVDVLSRGYGRVAGSVEQVDASGNAARFGDEPLELARRGVTVFVGAERWEAGKFAESGTHLTPDGAAIERGHPVVHVLDDGFQHRRLGRDLDLVLLTVEDWRDCLLPGGNLREPLASLRRADVVVVREDEAAALAGVIAARSKAETWVIRRELVLQDDRPGRLFAFCGLARPTGFFGMLPAVAGSKAFSDHHAYADADFAGLVEAAKAAGANGFVTSAKDAVKISPAARQRLEAVGPLVVAELRVSLVDEAAAWERLESIVRR